MRCSLFQPNKDVKKAINDQANLYKDRVKKYHSDREVRGRTYEESLAVDHRSLTLTLTRTLPLSPLRQA